MRTRTSSTMTQPEILTDHLKRVGSISGLEALALYRIVSLTRQITTLKRRGMNIVGAWKKDNTGKKYKRYTFTPYPTLQLFN